MANPAANLVCIQLDPILAEIDVSRGLGCEAPALQGGLDLLTVWDGKQNWRMVKIFSRTQVES